MKKLAVANWKMYGTPQMASELVQAVMQQAQRCPGVQVVLCPPSILLYNINKIANPQVLALGGQDCHGQPEGAFTGDISAPMLKEAGCGYVIAGHSERRTAYKETSAQVASKASAAAASQLIPIICIGETLAEREAGQAEQVVGAQVRESIPDVLCRGAAAAGNFVLAYEPVWAIGSGKTPTVDDIEQMHRFIVATASERTGLAPDTLRVLYGGSVKAANAASIMQAEAVSGVLVGGASLKAEEFCGIIAAGLEK